MQQSKAKGSKGWTVFTVVAVVALGSTIASAGLGRGAGHRFAEASAAVHAECMETRTPCVNGAAPTPVLANYRAANHDLEIAKVDLEAGRTSEAAPVLAGVLASATHLDRSRTLVGSLVAAKLFDGVADEVDKHPALLESPFMQVALRRATFGSAQRPLEGERLHALSVLTTVPALVPVRTAGFTEASTTQAMTDVNATLRTMERDLVAGDVAACEAAASKPTGLAKHVVVGPSICKTAERIVVSGHRFERLRLRAAVRAHRPMTARAVTL